MNRYISTLWASMVQCIFVRISICYYSRTRTKSQRFYDNVTIRVGSSVVQISSVPLADLLRTYRVTLTALVLLPYYIAHAAHLNPGRERLLDSLKKVAISCRTTILMRKLRKKSILSLTEEATTSMVSVFSQLHPCRISVPYSPDSRLLAMTMVLRLLEFFELCIRRQQELRNSDSSITDRIQS